MADNKLSAQVTIDTKQATASLAGLNKSVKGSAETLAKLKPSAAAGGSALQSLSRIAQDAPFGFIAIQNNVTEAVASFGQLKTSLGSTGAALRAVGASMIGPGGILLAFSLVTSGVTALIQKYGSLGGAYDALLGKTKPLTEDQKEYAEAQQKSAVGVEKQRIELESLVKVASGDIGTKKQQVAALEELNKLIPDNIGFLTAQNIKTAEGTKILQAYTNAIINQAEAELLAGRAAELRVKLRERDKTLGQDLTKELQSAAKAQQQINAGASVAGALSGVNAVTKAVTLNKKAIIEGSAAYQAYMADYKELAELTARVGQLTAGSIELKMDDPKKIKALKDKVVKDLEAEFKSFDKVLATPEIVVLPSGIEIQDGLKKLNTFVKNAIDTDAATRTFTIPSNIIIKPQHLDKTISNLQKALNDAITGFETDAFAGIGEMIGAGIASGGKGIEDAARNIGNMFGAFLKQVGKIMIQTGVLAIAAKKALATLFANPYASIAVGVGLTALGQIVQSKLEATKFATGGIVTGPTLGMVGEAGQPEVILPLSKINQFMEQGQGGGGSLTLAVDFNKFIFGVNRGNRRNNRLF